MKATMIALALFLGLTVGGASLVPNGPAHAEAVWNNGNGGGAAGGGGAG
jgi:hypothetical protein